jgi:OOP family OmpA-OmpF porin
MRIFPAILSMALASGVLMAKEDQDPYRWIQFQGGVVDHRLQNPNHQQPAAGFGVGNWIDAHWGVEVSGLVNLVEYGMSSRSREGQALLSVMYNPFSNHSKLRPFARLGLGAAVVSSPISGGNAFTTRLDRVAGLGIQFAPACGMLATLEGRLASIATHTTRKEAQVLGGIGVRWGQTATCAIQPQAAAPVAAVAPVAPMVPAAPIEPAKPVIAPAPAPAVVAAPAPGTVTRTRRIILDEATLHFGNNKAKLSKADQEAVAKVAAQLKEAKAPYCIVLSGHASKVGKASHNLRLSRKRAATVVKALADAGIPADDIYSKGLSFGHPKVQELTRADQAKNRRVEIGIKIDAETVEIRQIQTPVVD